MELRDHLKSYIHTLREKERAPSTIQKYAHDVTSLLQYCGIVDAAGLTKERVIQYKQWLEERRSVATVNAAIAAINGFLRFIKREDCCIKPLKVQTSPYRDRQRELSRTEYFRLLDAARRRSEKTAYMIETICSTGIRVSELRFITVAAVNSGMATVRNKGKCRTIFLPTKLCADLKRYCRNNKIASGSVFIGRKGRPLNRCTIWKRMKQLCAEARVKAVKVFPHNLRHLFAVCFYKAQRDLEHLSCILGHSSINTTRIYTQTSGREHQRQLNALMLTM